MTEKNIPSNKVRFAGIKAYYVELDADHYGLRMFKEAGIGEETVKAWIAERYLGTLYHGSDYWFAPALEKLLLNEKPQSPLEIYAAVSEIHCRLAMIDQGIDQKQFSSQDIQAAVIQNEERTYGVNQTPLALKVDDLLVHYGRNILAKFTETDILYDPMAMKEILLNVRKLQQQEILTDPLSRHIAQRVLESGEYFSAGISCVPESVFNRAHVGTSRPQAANLPIASGGLQM